MDDSSVTQKSSHSNIRRIVATYDYTDEAGDLLYQAVRYEPKQFSQRRPDGHGGWIKKLGDIRRVLYHLPELLAADVARTVYIVEGEKDVDNLRRLGLLATCNAMGAGKWEDGYTETLTGRRVCILPDNDEKGANHAQRVAGELHGHAADLRIVNLPGLPEKGDVSDWLADGGTGATLLRLTAEAPSFVPTDPNPDKRPRKRTTSTPIIRDGDSMAEQVKAYWSALDVFRYHGWANEEIPEKGEIRLTGHGGLLVGDPDNSRKRHEWYNHSEQRGGDQIDAWAYCTRRDRDTSFVEILREMATAASIEWRDPRPFRPEPEPMPAHTVTETGSTVFKTTPAPEPKRIETPVYTPSIARQFAVMLRDGDVWETVLRKMHGVRNVEVYRTAMVKLIGDLAPKKRSWVFFMPTDLLGEELGKSKMSASRTLHKLDDWGLIAYRHAGTDDEHEEDDAAKHRAGPPMQVDLRPLVRLLWNLFVSKRYNQGGRKTVVTLNDEKNGDVYQDFCGNTTHGDASMRILYKYAIRRLGLPTVLQRSLSMSALLALDDLARNGPATRRELVDRTGMTKGSAAGGTRILEQLGLVDVETLDARGKPKEYTLRPDWRRRLEKLIPEMTSYGARYRLILRNYTARLDWLEQQAERTDDMRERMVLRQRFTRNKQARRKWEKKAIEAHAYRRPYVAPEPTPPPPTAEPEPYNQPNFHWDGAI